MGANIFLTNDISEYTDTELVALAETIRREQVRRENGKRLKAWQEMVCTIRKYIDEYGSFRVVDYEHSVRIDETMVDDWEREEICVE